MSAMEYIGPGYISGIPARDLTAAEFKALTAAQQEIVKTCGLYEVKKTTRRRKKDGE